MIRLFVFSVLFAVLMNLQAQTNYAGIRGGVNLTGISGDFFKNDRDLRTGVSIGASFGRQFRNRMTISWDMLYDQRGFETPVYFWDADLNPTGSAIICFYYDYLSLPIKVGYSGRGSVSAFANFGLVPGLLILAKTIQPVINDAGGYYPNTETINVTKRVKPFDLALMIEAGGSWRLNRKYSIFSAAGFRHSLTSITNTDYFANNSILHYGMTVSAGFRFHY
jgi:hypothetical protein